MTPTERLSVDIHVRYMAKDRIVSELATAIADENGWEDHDDREMAREQAEIAVTALIEDAVLFTSERWEETCHACEQRIGDHLIDGRCPPVTDEDDAAHV